MVEITEKDINNFFIKYYSDYYKDNNLIYDNVKVFRELIILIYEKLKGYIENNKEEADWNKITRSTIIEYIPLISEFYKKQNIDIDIDKLIEDGTLTLKYRERKELINNKGKLLNGTSKYEDGHKSVELYNNGLITDSIVLVHELSHYLNQTDKKRSQLNDLFTELLAFTEELIYLDYLNSLGYEYEYAVFNNRMLKTFFYTASNVYPLVKLHVLFNELGELSEENYKMIFQYNDYQEMISVFKDIINDNKKDIINFNQDIINNKELMDKLNDEFISDMFYVLAAPLSIYMYEEYKKDSNFIEKIKELNETIKEETDVNKCLKTIGLNKESIDKISRSFNTYLNSLNELKQNKLISEVRNRVFKNDLAFGKDNPIALHTKNTSIYRVTGYNQLQDIINSGYIRPKEGKLKGGHHNEVFWTQGGDKLFYYDKRPVLEVSEDTLHDNQIGALSIDDLIGVWQFDEKNNKYINTVEYIKEKYNEINQDKEETYKSR